MAILQSLPAFIDSLTTQHWLTIIAIVVAIIIGSFTISNILAQHRERKLKTYEATPVIKATINRKRYEGGWRSVQLHVVQPDEQQNFQYKNWLIERAHLIRPWFGALLARAENDDYATGVFYPDSPMRALSGKVEGRPQRFALEFFIKFKQQDDRGRSAKFRVTFSHINKRRRHTAEVSATVPLDAE